jgi:hypothetical protein
MNQYVQCCKEFGQHSIFQNRMQHFLNDPSQHRLDLSCSRASTRDVYVLLLALSGGERRRLSRRSANILSPRGRGPQLTALDLSDNRVVADSEFSAMLAMLAAPERAPSLFPALSSGSVNAASLLELNLSGNCLGVGGAAALATMMRSGRLGLRTLVIRRAALQDNGCAAIAAAVGPRQTLTCLDISENGAAQARVAGGGLSGVARGLPLVPVRAHAACLRRHVPPLHCYACICTQTYRHRAGIR